MKVVVSSTNPVKIAATKNAFVKCFPGEEIAIESVSAPSGVADQPMSEEETMEGAENRAKNAKLEMKEADYWVGIEAGLQKIDGRLLSFAWVVILGGEKEGLGRSMSIFLPKKIADLIESGMEFSQADDTVFNRENSKHHSGGAIQILTKDLITRVDQYERTVISALIPFMNPELY